MRLSLAAAEKQQAAEHQQAEQEHLRRPGHRRDSNWRCVAEIDGAVAALGTVKRADQGRIGGDERAATATTTDEPPAPPPL